MLLLVWPGVCKAQQDDQFDEISIDMNLQGIGGFEIPAVLHRQSLFLAVSSLFDFLKIKNTASPLMDSVSGFLIFPQATYLIDKPNHRIIYQGKIFNLKPEDLILTESNLYLQASYFGPVFGLECRFSFRNLTVALIPKIEVPLIREMRQQQMRDNLNRLKGDIRADSSIGRNYSLLNFGMMDWSVISTQKSNLAGETRLNASLGGTLL